MTTTHPRSFYQRFIMARNSFNPRDFGVDMDRDPFIDLMCEEFSGFVRGSLTIDELVLRPRSAIAFCDHVRTKHGYYDLPDDIIMRVVMRRRKNPTE